MVSTEDFDSSSQGSSPCEAIMKTQDNNNLSEWYKNIVTIRDEMVERLSSLSQEEKERFFKEANEFTVAFAEAIQKECENGNGSRSYFDIVHELLHSKKVNQN